LSVGFDSLEDDGVGVRRLGGRAAVRRGGFAGAADDESDAIAVDAGFGVDFDVDGRRVPAVLVREGDADEADERDRLRLAREDAAVGAAGGGAATC